MQDIHEDHATQLQEIRAESVARATSMDESMRLEQTKHVLELDAAREARRDALEEMFKINLFLVTILDI